MRTTTSKGEIGFRYEVTTQGRELDSFVRVSPFPHISIQIGNCNVMKCLSPRPQSGDSHPPTSNAAEIVNNGHRHVVNLCFFWSSSSPHSLGQAVRWTRISIRLQCPGNLGIVRYPHAHVTNESGYTGMPSTCLILGQQFLSTASVASSPSDVG